MASQFVVVAYYDHDHTGKYRANCAELYAYLLESYAEPGAENENLVQSLLEQAGRDTDSSIAACARRARRRIDIEKLL
jgi:hypothetical protein